jgi:hypothetical protein
VLADDDKNPGSLVCVPSKSTKSESMDKDIEKKFKAEHERHGKAFAKAIDEFKSIDEFTKAVDSEQDEHLTNTMKAVDESYETMGREPNKEGKSIDEFKAAMKAEHLKHVKAIDKAIDEFKSAYDPDAEDDGKQKAIDAFTKSAGEELDRHEKAHKAMCEAEFGKGDDDEEKQLTDLIKKAGRAISAKNKDKLKAIVKAIEDHHTEHERFTNDVTAAIKELIGSEDGDGGGEPSKQPKGDESEGEKALNSRSSTSGASDELEAYLLGQRLVRQVKSASEDALRQSKEGIRRARSQGR